MPYSSKVAYKTSTINNIDANVQGKAGLPYMVGRSSWISIFFKNLPGTNTKNKRGFNEGGSVHNTPRGIGMVYSTMR
jgi:hypothetical protein